MSKIRIYFSSVRSANTGLKQTAARLDTLADDLELLRKQLDPQILGRYQINAGLISCRNSASDAYTRMKKLYNAVDSGVEKYQAAEAQLNRGVPDNSKVRG